MRNIAFFFILCVFVNTHLQSMETEPIEALEEISQPGVIDAMNAFQEFTNIQNAIGTADENNPIDYALFNRIQTVYPKLKKHYRNVISTFLFTLENLLENQPHSAFNPQTIQYAIMNWLTKQQNILSSQREKAYPVALPM